ncbi:hypothetical protein [Streptomyces sp. NBC_00827]|uniref:hypothetical protein n=1 Tax=Streptomyces sp. NBC_00827 TaxID=2903677 RepID=UPI00386D2B36|nr:hypothetical protein OG569_07240 [Streptomyces sp. NBC_00827]
MTAHIGRLTARKLSIARRVGLPPCRRGSLSGATCPDIFELTDGTFAVIGRDETDRLEPLLPPGRVRSADERIVVVDRQTMTCAKDDIPDE